jgi:hypothetical protein
VLRQELDVAADAYAEGLAVSAAVNARSTVDLLFDDDDVRHEIAVSGARAATCAITPQGITRTLRVDDTDVHERIIVDADVPNAVFEWTVTAAPIVIEWTVQSRDSIAWNMADASLIVATHADLLLLTLSAEAGWEVIDASDDVIARLIARARIGPASHPVRLYATSAHRSDSPTDSFPTLHEISARMIADAATMRRRVRHGLSLDVAADGADADADDRMHSTDAIGTALEWSKQIIPRISRDTDSLRASSCAALLACGDATAARRTLLDIADPEWLLLAAARYFDWTADAPTITALWPRVVQAFDTPGIASRAKAAILSVAEETGHRELLQAGALAADAPSAGARAAGAPESHWPDQEDAIALFDAMLPAFVRATGSRQMMRGGQLVEFVNGLAYGVFGIAPEAARGRLRIAPRLPATWRSADLRGIRIGDASVTFRYQSLQDDGMALHRYTVVQDAGPVPIRLIFEPALSLATAAVPTVAASVDGVAASLDMRRVGNRIVTPVQVVLDDERVVEIRTGT